MRTNLTGLRVTDLERSRAFYRALGYAELGTVAFDDGGRLVVLGFPGEPVASLELVHRPGPVVLGAGLDHVAVSTDDLAGTVARLTAAGLEPGPVEAPGGSDGPRTSWLTDPDGHRIELVQWPPGHPDGLTAADFS